MHDRGARLGIEYTLLCRELSCIVESLLFYCAVAPSAPPAVLPDLSNVLGSNGLLLLLLVVEFVVYVETTTRVSNLLVTANDSTCYHAPPSPPLNAMQHKVQLL